MVLLLYIMNSYVERLLLLLGLIYTNTQQHTIKNIDDYYFNYYYYKENMMSQKPKVKIQIMKWNVLLVLLSEIRFIIEKLCFKH